MTSGFLGNGSQLGCVEGSSGSLLEVVEWSEMTWVGQTEGGEEGDCLMALHVQQLHEAFLATASLWRLLGCVKRTPNSDLVG